MTQNRSLCPLELMNNPENLVFWHFPHLERKREFSLFPSKSGKRVILPFSSSGKRAYIRVRYTRRSRAYGKRLKSRLFPTGALRTRAGRPGLKLKKRIALFRCRLNKRRRERQPVSAASPAFMEHYSLFISFMIASRSLFRIQR